MSPKKKSIRRKPAASKSCTVRSLTRLLHSHEEIEKGQHLTIKRMYNLWRELWALRCRVEVDRHFLSEQSSIAWMDVEFANYDNVPQPNGWMAGKQKFFHISGDQIASSTCRICHNFHLFGSANVTYTYTNFQIRNENFLHPSTPLLWAKNAFIQDYLKDFGPAPAH